MLRFVAAFAALAIGATVVHAQSAAIPARKEAFKAIGAAAKMPGGMIKGDVPFDLAKVKAALGVYQEQAAKLKSLFPDDSQTGGETEVLPVAFTEKDKFLAGFDKLAADAKVADGAITDEASFKANWGKVMGNCGGCHKAYKKPG